MVSQESEFHANFIKTLKEKIPGRGKLADVLSEKLCIEKEAVYRRLRGDVSFSFGEIANIAKQLHISLDRMLEIVSPYRSKLFQLHVQDYFLMEKIDYKMSHDYVAAIQAAGNSPYSEFGVAAGRLPLHSCVLHPPVFRFYVMKWMYQFSQPENVPSYCQIEIPKKLLEFHQQYLDAIQDINYTYIIWNEFFMLYLIRDIQYFHSIRLLTDEDVALLKENISLFLDSLEKTVIRGTFKSDNKLDIYVSSLNFETSYSYLFSDKMYISMVDAFTLGAFTSLENDVCEKLKVWMQVLKRTSTLISGTDKPRILFFEKQRELLEQI